MSWTTDTIASLKGKVAVVTGANSGIGLHVTRVLASKSATVVLACRNEARAQAALGQIEGDAQFMPLDLASLASVQAFTERFAERYGRLDLLINNAGVMMPPLGRTAEGFELQFGINHLGHFALTGLLLPMIRDREGGRVVVVSSRAHHRGRIDFENLGAEKRYRKAAAYAQSKLANLLFAYELQRRLEDAERPAICVAAHPGWANTNLWAHFTPGRVFNRVLWMEADEGALPVLMAACARGVVGGSYYGPTGVQEIRGTPGLVSSSKRSYDREVAARLWAVSEAMTGVVVEV